MTDYSAWTVETLAAFIEQRHAGDMARLEERYAADQKALMVALATNEKRLDGMNEFRGAMTDNAARTVTRVEFEAERRFTAQSLAQAIKPLVDHVDLLSRTNWPLMIGYATVVLSLLGGCWLLIGLQISVAETPLALAIEQLKSTTGTAGSELAAVESRVRSLEQQAGATASFASESKADRGNLTAHAASLDAQISSDRTERRANEARFGASLVEIETQFRNVSGTFNAATDKEEQWFAVIWAKVFPGTNFPRSYFRPSLSQSPDAAVLTLH